MYGINICGGNITLGHSKLYRNFIILQEDERGHSVNEKVLSGYAKVEAKGDKCKISFYAQNLKANDKYSMILICCRRDCKELIDIGLLDISDSGKADTSKEYYVNNVAGLGISYEKISGAAICKNVNGEAEFIMHGFMNGEEPAENWRKFKLIKVENAVKSEERVNIDSKNKENISTKSIEEKVEENILSEDERNKCKEKKDSDHKKNDHIKEFEKEEYKEEKKDICKKCDKEEKSDTGKKCDCIKEDKKDTCDKYNIDDMIHKVWNKTEYCTHKINMNIKDMDYDWEVYGFIKIKIRDKYEWKKFKVDKDKIKEFSKRIEENTKLDLEIPDFDKYEAEIDNFNSTNYIGMSEDSTSYFENITKGFECFNENFDDIDNCKWYRVNVNSINDLCDQSDYNKYTLAYYPMINYYPYISRSNHFLLGYKYNDDGQLKYIIYGIPGSKDRSDQPYGGKTGFVTWTNNNNRNQGYWFMFYDFKKSSIVIPMKKD